MAALVTASGLSGAQAQPLAEASAVVRTEQVQARLLAHAPDGVRDGATVWLGLQIEHQPHWHTYWSNPGDSGLSTTLNWTLPSGAQAGGIQWPAPKKLPFGPLLNYGYEGTVLLPVAVTLPSGLPPAGQSLSVQLQADWLVCKDVCIPESGQFTVALPVGQRLGVHEGAFMAARAAQPQQLQGAKGTAQVQGGELVVTAQGLPAAWRGQSFAYLAGEAGVIEHARPETVQWQGDTATVRVTLAAQRAESPAALTAVLLGPDASAVALPVALPGGWPSPAAAQGDSAGAAVVAALGTGAAKAELPPVVSPVMTPVMTPATATVGLLAALALAFVGGLILNLMPCVFPVLSLKAFGLVNEDAAHRRVGALAYTAGVVLSFVALAALLIGLRAGGEEIGWGFQLQTPWVVAALSLLFTLIALNLIGVFEFGTWLPSGAAGWRAKRPWLDQAATGVLSVAIASPCTAPFMGAALGAALTLPAPQALSVFVALGLGMAAPYAAIALVPQLAALLPRPGAWMARVRTLLAFPMLATVLWLVWVLGQQTGIDGATALLVLLLGLAYAVWAWAQGGWGWRISGLMVAVAAGGWAAPAIQPAEGSTAVATTSTTASPTAGWSAWTPEAQAQALASGKPLLVDFTAAWCISCQYNKRNALSDAGVLADLKAANVQLMRADWTRRDPAITAELRRLGRSGVPVYALYTAATGATPVLLPEILTASGVRRSLAQSLASSAPAAH